MMTTMRVHVNERLPGMGWTVDMVEVPDGAPTGLVTLRRKNLEWRARIDIEHARFVDPVPAGLDPDETAASITARVSGGTPVHRS